MWLLLLLNFRQKRCIRQNYIIWDYVSQILLMVCVIYGKWYRIFESDLSLDHSGVSQNCSTLWNVEFHCWGAEMVAYLKNRHATLHLETIRNCYTQLMVTGFVNDISSKCWSTSWMPFKMAKIKELFDQSLQKPTHQAACEVDWQGTQ